jgi:hypothetical protein
MASDGTRFLVEAAGSFMSIRSGTSQISCIFDNNSERSVCDCINSSSKRLQCIYLQRRAPVQYETTPYVASPKLLTNANRGETKKLIPTKKLTSHRDSSPLNRSITKSSVQHNIPKGNKHKPAGSKTSHKQQQSTTFSFQIRIKWARFIMAKKKREQRVAHKDSSLVVVEAPFLQSTPNRPWVSILPP